MARAKTAGERLLKEEFGGMLILVRKSQQGIWIQSDKGDVWVRVLSVERDRVKLGITAPRDVKVMRQELLTGDAPPQAHPKKPRS